MTSEDREKAMSAVRTILDRYWGAGSETQAQLIVDALAALSPAEPPKNHAPWCSWTHHGPCPTENEAEAMRREIAMPPLPRSPAKSFPATEPVRAAAEKLVRAVVDWRSHVTLEQLAGELDAALRAALAAEPKPVEITDEMERAGALAIREMPLWQIRHAVEGKPPAEEALARAVLAAALSEARTEGGEPQ